MTGINSPLLTALTYALIPSVVAVAGTTGATFWRPGAAFRSGLLHFAAGVAFAVVAVELLPRLIHDRQALGWIITGFALGVVIMLGVRWLEATIEERGGEGAQWPVGLIASGVVDQAMDGVLLGIGIAAGTSLGALLSLSMAIEDLSFGLAIALGFGKARGLRWQKIGVAAALGAILIVVTIVAALALGGLSSHIVKFLLALSASALIYVVTEQLLVEAHDAKRSALLATTFFVGFLFIMVLGMFTGA